MSDSTQVVGDLPLPDAMPLLELPSQAAARATFETWLASGQAGIGVLTGPPTSGRTRVLEQVVLWLAERDDRAIGFPQPPTGKRSDAGLLREAIVALGSEPTGRTGLQLTTDLRQVVSTVSTTGMPPLLLLDDANLTGSQLEILGTVFGGTGADRTDIPLQVLLAGPPDVLDRLQRRPRLASLLRTAVHLDGLTAAEVAQMMDAWLDVARSTDPDLPALSNGARESILQVAGTDPGVAFDLLTTALTAARRMGTRRVGMGLTEAVAAGMRARPAAPGRRTRAGQDTPTTPATLPLPGMEGASPQSGEAGP